MSKTYIHIGYPKCASTYLQDEIFPQLGNYSHIVRAPNEEKYYPFNRSFRPELFRQTVERHLKNPGPDHDHLLISFEDWCEMLFQEFADVLCKYRNLRDSKYEFSNTVVLNNLKAAYPDAHIIIIIREQVSWINSRYKMLYRGAQTFKPVEAFLDRPLNGYDHLIESAQGLFGKDRVTVIPFELLRLDKKLFIEKICGLINPRRKIEISDKSVNIAPALKRIVFYHRIKTRIRHILDKHGLRILYGPLKGLVLLILYPILWLKYKNTLCPDPCVNIPENIRNRFKETNRNVERLTGLDLKPFGYLL